MDDAKVTNKLQTTKRFCNFLLQRIIFSNRGIKKAEISISQP